MAAHAAARAAGLAAASAYTHPLADVQQTKHIVGPAAYAALTLELYHAGDPTIIDCEVAWAIAHAPPAVHEVLQQMPARQAGKVGWTRFSIGWMRASAGGPCEGLTSGSGDRILAISISLHNRNASKLFVIRCCGVSYLFAVE
jgi:hypothetical protein